MFLLARGVGNLLVISEAEDNGDDFHKAIVHQSIYVFTRWCVATRVARRVGDQPSHDPYKERQQELHRVHQEAKATHKYEIR